MHLSGGMTSRHRQTMEEHIARLEYQLAKALEKCEIAEEKLAHIQRLAVYGIEHPPSRYMYDASGSQPPIPQYVPSRSIENAKRMSFTQNNQVVVQPMQQTQTQNTHMFFE